MSVTKPPSAKQVAKNKTNDLDLVIISTALNSTLNRITDVMERSLDVAAANPGTAAALIAPPIIMPSVKLPASNPSSTSTSSTDLLDQAI